MRRPNSWRVSAAALALFMILPLQVALANGVKKDTPAATTAPAGQMGSMPDKAATDKPETPAGGTEPAMQPATPTTLTVSIKRTEERAATATALLADLTGKPAAGEEISFARRTAFGWADLGRVRTGRDGTATVPFFAYDGQEITVTAKFAGDPKWKAAEAQSSLSLPEVPKPLPTGNLFSMYPNPKFVLGLVILVGGVWVTYGWVFFKLTRLRRAGVERQELSQIAD